MKDGFLKAAAFSPALRVADCTYNSAQIIQQLREAAGRGVKLAVFPEFCLTGYTCGDMFLRGELQRQAEKSLDKIRQATEKNNLLVCVGMPVNVQGRLFNCAVYLQNGEIKGAVPKTYVPNYGEFYEKRWFVSALSLIHI